MSISFAAQKHRIPNAVHIGSDLQNSLVTFALGCGAISAHIDLAGETPILVTVAANGNKFQTTLTGRNAEWHAALNRMAAIYDENTCAGLLRFLGTIHKRADPKHEATLSKRYLDEIKLWVT